MAWRPGDLASLVACPLPLPAEVEAITARLLAAGQQLAKARGDVADLATVIADLDEQMSMLRNLLADRFKLAFHREPKELSLYALVVAKGGSKLKESTGPPDALPETVSVVYPESGGGVRIVLPARNATMAQFASIMNRAILDRPVVDKTGLSGKYDFDLEWTPDETQFGGQVPQGTPEHPKPDLFAALQQQLGLRLEATKGPIEALVIDWVERPSEN